MSKTPYVAVHRLNGGKTPPGGFITFENKAEANSLLESGAIREATEVELTVFEQTQTASEAPAVSEKVEKVVKAAKGGKPAAAETTTTEPAAGAAEGGENALV